MKQLNKDLIGNNILKKIKMLMLNIQMIYIKFNILYIIKLLLINQ